MRKIVLSLAGLLVVSFVYGQIYSRETTPTKSLFGDSFEYLIHPSFIYSMQSTSFYDSEFFNELNNGKLDRRYSDEYLLRWTIYPVILDFGLSSSRFTNKDSAFALSGLNYSGSLCLPYSIEFSKYITPYIGIGHQTYFKYNSASTYWKAGVMINIIRGSHNEGLFIINAEYKQSLNVSGAHGFNQFSVGIGIRGDALYYTLGGIGIGIYKAGAWLFGYY
ncbi:MAG: hypothetical protein GQ564_14325 [Bacteroidales bacterium]|nr:hypothetical protein [Bacteroidales bacterium]